MNSDLWREVDLVVRRALELPELERPPYLESIYKEKPELKAEVESLLKREPSLTGLASGWTMRPFEPHATPESLLGRQLGAYRLTSELGSGGMGLVYRARREDGQFDKEVAIKILYWGLHSASLWERFGRERQMLARLEHPGITRLLDSGLSEDGLPYLVMELVEGIPITEYSKREALSVKKRMELMAQVCDAAHYAHQNLVVHRDLKPGNILVRADGQAKLLDFGVAKWLEDSTVTMTAARGWAPFTPKYASPEQLAGGAITTATDVYSLGLILFELIEGRLHEEFPLRLKDADLAAIVHKATQRDPSQRYTSAADLAMDLRAYAAGRPVKARRWLWPLAMWKWMKRHKRATVLLAANAAILVTLTVRYQAESARAIRRAADLRELAGTVTSEVTGLLTDLPKSTAVRHKLLLASLKYLDRLSSGTTDPLLLSELAKGYSNLAQVTGHTVTGSIGDLPAAVDLHARARRLIERSSRDEPDNLLIRQRYIWILLAQAVAQPSAEGKQTALLAEQLFESLRGKAPETEELLVLEANVNEQRAAMVNGWGSPDNRPFLETARAAYEKLSSRHPDNLKYKLKRADLIDYLSDFMPDLAQRVEQSESALALRRAVLQQDPQNPWYHMSYYFGCAHAASHYRLAGKPSHALPLVREAANHMRRASELDPGDASMRGVVAFALGDLAALEAEVGNRQEATAAAMQAIPLANDRLAKDSNQFWPNWGLAQAYGALAHFGAGNQCAYYEKALFHARKADSFRVNSAVRSLIGELDQKLRACTAP